MTDCHPNPRERSSNQKNGRFVTLFYGLLAYRSCDQGKTFEGGDMLGAIDGREYVYAFECLTESESTWMVLTSHRYYQNPSQQVDVVR